MAHDVASRVPQLTRTMQCRRPGLGGRVQGVKNAAALRAHRCHGEWVLADHDPFAMHQNYTFHRVHYRSCTSTDFQDAVAGTKVDAAEASASHGGVLWDWDSKGQRAHLMQRADIVLAGSTCW